MCVDVDAVCAPPMYRFPSEVEIVLYECSCLITVRVIKNVTITENRQQKVNDYPITVNG